MASGGLRATCRWTWSAAARRLPPHDARGPRRGVFGDTSFLSKYGGSGNSEGRRDPDSPPSSKPTRFLSRTLQHVRKTPLPPVERRVPWLSHPLYLPSRPSLKTPYLCLSSTWTTAAWWGRCCPTSTSSPDEPLCSYGTNTHLLSKCIMLFIMEIHMVLLNKTVKIFNVL